MPRQPEEHHRKRRHPDIPAIKTGQGVIGRQDMDANIFAFVLQPACPAFPRIERAAPQETVEKVARSTGRRVDLCNRFKIREGEPGFLSRFAAGGLCWIFTGIYEAGNRLEQPWIGIRAGNGADAHLFDQNQPVACGIVGQNESGIETDEDFSRLLFGQRARERLVAEVVFVEAIKAQMPVRLARQIKPAA